jgi:hypothetical protein
MGETERGYELLGNWARWGGRGSNKMILRHYYKADVAATRLYRSEEIWDDNEIEVPIDEQQAIEVEAIIVGKLPAHLKNTITHMYYRRPQMRVDRKTLDGWLDSAARMVARIYDK